MKKLIVFALLFSFIGVQAQEINYSDHFTPQTLRIDYNRCGMADSEEVFFEQMRKEGKWSGPRQNLIDPFQWGEYRVEVYDAKSDKLIYSRGYAGLYSEWQATAEAKKIKRCFYETVLIPFPKNKVRLELYSRDRTTKLNKVFEYPIDPNDYFIKTEKGPRLKSYMVHDSGDPKDKVDVVFLPDGFTDKEMNLFREAAKEFSDALFKTDPFDAHEDDFNIWVVEAPSKESGTDIPGKNIWKETVMNTSFYTFDSERYLMTHDIKSVRDVAANAPYDLIIILVNTKKYGGGGVYNYYGTFSAFNPKSIGVWLHEFGHNFTWLADEYYTSDVSFSDFIDTKYEPLQPNVTTLVKFDTKWKKMLKQGTPIPTPRTPEYDGILGAFEGGLYSGKDIYSPMQKCKMNWLDDPFCPVCRQTIIDMIYYYTR
ncbi:MAG: peptidase M64 [Bacteroidales bacterium]|nr:peptidase M64 [Bacteroidales bacterium]